MSENKSIEIGQVEAALSPEEREWSKERHEAGLTIDLERGIQQDIKDGQLVSESMSGEDFHTVRPDAPGGIWALFESDTTKAVTDKAKAQLGILITQAMNLGKAFGEGVAQETIDRCHHVRDNAARGLECTVGQLIDCAMALGYVYHADITIVDPESKPPVFELGGRLLTREMSDAEIETYYKKYPLPDWNEDDGE